MYFQPNYLAFCKKEQYNNIDYTIKVGMNMNANEFDLDFDFEKEYGSDPLKEEPAPQAEDDFDLKSILGANFDMDSDLFNTDSEYDGNFDYSDYPIEPEEEDPADDPAPTPEQPDDPVLDDMQPIPEEEPVQDYENDQSEQPVRRSRRPRAEQPAPPAPESKQEDGQPAAPPRRKKPLSKMRQFKNDTLPRLIAGFAALLILIFVVGSISRAVKNHQSAKDSQANASQAAKTKEEQEKELAQSLLNEAADLAAGYDYDGAIAKLQSFGDTAKNAEISTRISEYQQAKSQLVAHNDPSSIPNLSFNVLIADPSRAFSNKQYGDKYNMNFVTIDEFQKILEQLYENDYVLVDMDSFIAETDANGAATYSSKPLYLPDGKKPFMLTETMVNYFNYMIDGDGDGTPDKDGAGFASRLVLQNGEIKAEMVTSAGETVVGDYDLVPILEAFIDEHPDFSYQGSRATLAVTGHEGLFGYRTNASVIESKGQEYYDQQVAGAKEIIAALTNAGYEIACYTYSNIDYGAKNATQIQADLASWIKEVVPILGQVDTLVYAKSSDISTTGDYTGSKYNVLHEAGFRYFITSGSSPSMKVTSDYVRQVRLEVTGTKMAHAASMYSSYFDAKTILNSLRGDVPQS